MLAIAAAVVFGLAFLLDLLDAGIGIGPAALIALGLALLALHQGGIGAAGLRGPRTGRRARR